jgi:hypothetical protein
MDAVKSNLQDAITTKHGSCVLRMDGRCAIFRLLGKAPQFIVYVRDDEPGCILCYYAHEQDLRNAYHVHSEFKCWREQQCYQMIWRYPRTGFASVDFVQCAMHFLDTAVENMLGHPLPGHKRPLTISEAEWRVKNIVRPHVEDTTDVDSVDEYKKPAEKRACSTTSSFASSRL